MKRALLLASSFGVFAGGTGFGLYALAMLSSWRMAGLILTLAAFCAALIEIGRSIPEGPADPQRGK